ncbi:MULTISPECIES: alanine/glycine:cation symporter family protein [unclassified Luteococcus]|uniref:alanine/glycine:cation symporter family protein n=1 Tax=unclassified Luteococcus TaxID=2639923 RepID=UPI00313C214B
MNSFDKVMAWLNTTVAWLNDQLSWVLIVLIIAAGVVFTIWTRGVQFRKLGTMFRVALDSRTGAGDGISSFQAFCISLASRVGTGAIAGVAIALALGGPGAVFWMWLMAFLGMATAFVEATLAQLYKVPHTDGTFRGGPAYYMQRGMKNRPMGMVFAIFLIFTFGFAFQMVQANTIAAVFDKSFHISPSVTAIFLAVATGAVVLGGVKSVAKVTEWMAPIMALAYVLLAVAVIVLNIDEVPAALANIVKGAFGLDQALAGVGGGLAATVLNGIKRGLYANEAGMGSAPNAAAAATTSHPAHQGLIQSLGVFIDSMLVCTATAVVILLSDASIYTPGVTTKAQAGATLTQDAMMYSLGTWVGLVFTVLVFVFAFSTLIGNETYAEINMDFLRGGRAGELAIRLMTIGSAALGAVLALDFVWSLADVAMTLMAITNLIALVFLGRYAVATMRDFESHPDPITAQFNLDNNPFMQDDIPGEVWHKRPGHEAGKWFHPSGEDALTTTD